MGKMQLLILLPGYQFYGQEQALLVIARALKLRGVDSHFLIHHGWGEDVAHILDDLDFPWHALHFGTIWSLSLARRDPTLLFKNIWAVAHSSFAFMRLVRKHRYSHLLTGNVTFTFYLLPALLVSKINLIYRHGDDAADHSIFHRFINHSVFRRVDKHIVNCEYLRKQLIEKFPGLEADLIYNVPRQVWGQIKADTLGILPEPGNDRKKITIMYIGQIAEHKGLYVLFEAFRSLATDHPNLVLELVGDIPGIGNARSDEMLIEMERIKSDYPDRVFLHSFQSDLSVYFSAADIYVCPSIYQEPSPNVVLEAKWFSLPSVVFDVGGIPELISHKVDGFVCREISPLALSEGINYFLSDMAARKAAGYAARKSIDERFGPERFAKQWLEILAPTLGRE